MIIAESRWEIGPFVVRQAVRPDNPAWPAYLVFRGEKLVGKSFSMPDLDACQWLERQARDEVRYAESSAKLPDKGRVHALRGLEKARAFSRSIRAKRKRLVGSLETLVLHIPDLEEVN